MWEAMLNRLYDIVNIHLGKRFTAILAASMDMDAIYELRMTVVLIHPPD